MSKDVVKNPDHYCFSKYEPKDVIREWGLNFNLGSAVKYIARAGRKDDIVQDLKKAREFLGFEIEALEAEREKSTSKVETHPNCNCQVRDLESGAQAANIPLPSGKDGVMIRVAVPADMPQDIVKKIMEKEILKVLGGVSNG